MAILMTADVPGMSKELYDTMIEQLRGPLRASPGFVLHAGAPTADGWRVTEVWQSRDDHERWYEGTVKPNMPPGMEPKIEVTELRYVLQP